MTTTIAIDEATRDRLKQLGGKGESYNEILNEIIDGYIAMQHRKLEQDKDDFTSEDKIGHITV